MSQTDLDPQVVLLLQDVIRKTVREELQDVNKTLGEVDVTGKGGTGLAGQLAHTNARVDELFRLKHMGMGAVTAVALFGALVILGIKSWVLDFVR